MVEADLSRPARMLKTDRLSGCQLPALSLPSARLPTSAAVGSANA